MDFPLQQYKWPKGAAFVSRTAEPFGGGLLEKERSPSRFWMGDQEIGVERGGGYITPTAGGEDQGHRCQLARVSDSQGDSLAVAKVLSGL